MEPREAAVASGTESDSGSGLPPTLLEALGEGPAGRIVLVTGAGCSIEEPTGLQPASRLSAQLHERLVSQGVLKPEDCDRPTDLTCVADAVFEKHDSKEHLVSRMPLERFRAAAPNLGHQVAAALMSEQRVSSVVTLNFDHAHTNAFSKLAIDHVAVINKREDAERVGASNLIYLHGNVESQFDDWVLRTSELEAGWIGTWREVLANRVLTTPIVVFAGLDSSAAVLSTSARLIRQVLGEATHVYFVNLIRRRAPRCSQSWISRTTPTSAWDGAILCTLWAPTTSPNSTLRFRTARATSASDMGGGSRILASLVRPRRASGWSGLGICEARGGSD